MGEKEELEKSEEGKEREDARREELPAWMQKPRTRAAEEVQDLARKQMKRRKARFEEIPEEAWAEAEEIDRKEDGKGDEISDSSSEVGGGL